MKRILLEIYLAKNLGDDLFLDAILKRYKNISIRVKDCPKEYSSILENYPNVINSYNNYINSKLKKFKLYNFIRSKLYAINYDSYIILGGSVFMEMNSWERLYNERKCFIDAFIEKKKTAFILGSNFGPYKNEKFKKKYNEIFKKSTDVSFRDTYSLNLFKNNSDNIRFNPDIILSLPNRSIKNIRTIGISVIDLESRNELRNQEESYINNICLFIQKAYKEKYKITLLSFCEQEGDMRAINKIKSRLPDTIFKNIRIYNYDGNLENALDILSRFELIIATRFHSMILSQVYDQGVLPFIYSDKTLNVLKDIGLNQLYIDIRDNKTIDIDILWEKISNNKINIDEYRDKALKHFDVLDSYIN